MQRIYRSREQKVIAGVCGGLAEYFRVDVTLVRLAWALIFFAGGTGGLLYLIAWIIIPEAPVAASRTTPDTGRAEQPAAEEAGEEPAQPPPPARTRAEEAGKPDERSRVIGLVLIGLGGYFLLQNVLPRFWIGRLWPLGLVVLGLIVIMSARGEKR